MMVGRRAVGLAAVLATGSALSFVGLGACSSDDASQGFSAQETGSDAATPFDAPRVVVSEDGTAIIFGDGANVGSFDASGCPGAALPEDAMTTACAIDTSASCPACASWGFVCASGSSPMTQGPSAASFCRTIALDGSALVCCTQPACVVSTTGGSCDASTETRYECNGGAVPQGTCAWLGPGAPNDYCCQ